MYSRWLAIVLVMLLAVPTIVPSDWAASAAGITLTADSARAAVFTLDGTLGPAQVAALDDPLDRVSATQMRVLELGDAAGTRLELVAVGASTGFMSATNPYPPAFHTTSVTAAEAAIGGQHSLLILCRLIQFEVPAPCTQTHAAANILIQPVTNRDQLGSGGQGAADQPATWTPEQTPLTFGYDPRVAAIPATTGGITGVIMSSQAFEGYSVFYGKLPAPRDGDRGIFVADGSLTYAGRTIYFREPVMRLSAPTPIYTCTTSWPGEALTLQYAATPSSVLNNPAGLAATRAHPVAKWLDSCSPTTSIQRTWTDWLSDPAVADGLAAASQGDGLGLSSAMAAYMKDHIALYATRYAYPSNGEYLTPYRCIYYSVTCLRMVPFADGHAPAPVQWEVRDGENWVPALDDRLVFGGHARATVTMSEPYYGFSGVALGTDGTRSNTPLTITVELLPSPTTLTGTGVRVARPGESLSSASFVARPEADLLGGTPRPSVVPFISTGRSAPNVAPASGAPEPGKWDATTGLGQFYPDGVPQGMLSGVCFYMQAASGDVDYSLRTGPYGVDLATGRVSAGEMDGWSCSTESMAWSSPSLFIHRKAGGTGLVGYHQGTPAGQAYDCRGVVCALQPTDDRAYGAFVTTVTQGALEPTAGAFVHDTVADGLLGSIQACVETAASHNDHGLRPNFGQGGRLALPRSQDISCFDVRQFVDLTLPILSIGLAVEFRTGPGLGVVLELAHLNTTTGLGAWSAGLDTDAPWRVDMADLAALGNTSAPWHPQNPLFNEFQSRVQVKIPHLIITLPEVLPPDVLSDVVLLLTSALAPITGVAAVEIDDLPLTPLGQMILDDMDAAAIKAEKPILPILVSAGTLPRDVWDLAASEKLMTIHGLAGSPRFITIGAGNADGPMNYTRLGPSPRLMPKPDFIAPSGFAGVTLGAVVSALPLVELVQFVGVRGDAPVRAALAALALPAVNANGVEATFYEQGYGRLDAWPFIADLLNLTTLPDVDRLLDMAENASVTKLYNVSPSFPPRTVHTAEGQFRAMVAVGEDLYVKDSTYQWKRLDRATDALISTPISLACDASGIVASGSLIIGVGTDRVCTYDLATGVAYAPSGPHFSNRGSPAITADAHAVYIMGGTWGGTPKDEILRFDLVTRAVTLVAHLPAGFNTGTGVTDGDLMYAIGYAPFNCSPCGYKRSISVFDPKTNATWVAPRGGGYDASSSRGAAFDGRYVHIATYSKSMLRYDPLTGAVDSVAYDLGSNIQKGPVWAGDRLYVLTNGLKDIVEIGTGATRVVNVTPSARGVVFAASDPESLVGMTLPLGALNPIDLQLPRVHIDTPVVPGSLITDWGVTDNARAKRMGLPLFDIEAGLNASYADVQPYIESLLDMPDVVDALSFLTIGGGQLTFGGPDEVSTRTTHYALFDLFSTDLVLRLQSDLLERAIAISPDDVVEDPVSSLVNLTGAVFPKPYHLVEDFDGTVEGTADVSEAMECIDVMEFLKYANKVAGYTEQLKGQVIAGAGASGTPLLGRELTWLTTKTIESGAVNYAGDKVCELTSLVWIVTYLAFVRSEMREAMRLRALVGDASTWAAKYENPPSDTVAREILDQTGQAAGIPVVARGTVSELTAIVDAIDREIDHELVMLMQLLWNLRMSKYVDNVNPVLTLNSKPEQTSVAPLGPYIGLTLLTNHNLTILNPLTGEPLRETTLPVIGQPLRSLRNVTVPLPSLLWNNPELNVRREYRDGAASPNAVIMLEDMRYSFLEALNVLANITVDNLTVPVVGNVSFSAQANTSDCSVKINVKVEAIDDILAGLPIDHNITNQQVAASLALVRRALPDLCDTLVTPARDSLDGLVTSLYSRPEIVTVVTDANGTARFGNVFPVDHAARVDGYPYSTLALLDESPDYAGLSAVESTAEIADPDRTIHRLVRAAVAGPVIPSTFTDLPIIGPIGGLPHDGPSVLSPIVKGAPVADGPPIVEVHGSAVGPYHQFALDIALNITVPDMYCVAFDARESLFQMPVDSPLGCPDRLRSVLPDLPEIIVPLLCRPVEDAQGCVRALQAALVVPERVEACAAQWADRSACQVLLDALDLLTALLADLLPQTRETTPIPWAESMQRTLLRNPARFQLDEANLTARIAAANGLPADAPEALAVARNVLANLSKIVQASVTLHEPPRASSDTYTIAQALKGRGADRVSGYDWTAKVFPNASAIVDLYDRVLDDIEDALPRMNDLQARAWATGLRDRIAQMSEAELRAAARPPTPAEAAARLAAGGTSWVRAAGMHDIDLAARPLPIATTQDLAALDATLRQTAGASLGVALPGDNMTILNLSVDANLPWSRAIDVASTLQTAFDASASDADAVRDVVEIVARAVGWQIDRNGTDIRASSSTMTPKVGALTYTIPLVPQEYLRLRVDGEYYFQNTDGFLITTPSTGLRDVILAAIPELDDVVKLTEDPAARGLEIARTLNTLTSEILDGTATDGNYLRIEHLNSPVKVEAGASYASGDTVFSGGLLTRYGGLRVKNATNFFEMGTIGSRGYEDLHVIYLFFPLVDTSNAPSVGTWAMGLDPTFTPGTVQSLVETQGTKFIVHDLTLSWETYLGLKAASGGFDLSFKTPWRPNVEDANVYWSLPASRYEAGSGFVATSAGGSVQEQELALLQGFRTSDWFLSCGDTYGSGKWYMTGSESETRAMDSGRGNGFYTPQMACIKNGVSSLLPAKEKELGALTYYPVPSKTFLSWLQYDLNIAPFDPNTRAVPVIAKDKMSILDGRLWLSSPVGGLTDMLVGLLGGHLPAQAASIVHAVASAATGAAATTDELRDATVDALTDFVTSQGLGILSNISIGSSYVPTSRTGLSGSQVQHYFVVLDEADLARTSGASAWARPALHLSDDAAYDPARPFVPAPSRQTHGPVGKPQGPSMIVDPLAFVAQASGADAPLSALTTTLEDLDQDGIADALAAIFATTPGARALTLDTFDTVANAHAAADVLSRHGVVDVVALQTLPIVIATLDAQDLSLLASQPGFLRADPDVAVEATLDRSAGSVDVPAARAAGGLTGRGVTIGILDTGVDTTHTFLDDLDDDATTDDPKVVAWRDFIAGSSEPTDPHGHGTHVASIAAGTGGGTPFVGAAPGASLVVARVLDGGGRGSSASVLGGLDWMLTHRLETGLDIISMSLGRAGPGDGDSTFERAMTYAAHTGVAVFVAAGNAGEAPGSVGIPASARDIIAVGASDATRADNLIAKFSSRGPTADGRLKPDIVAPGVAVAAAKTGTGNGIAVFNGTSMATPMAAGIAALLVERTRHDLGGMALHERIKATADDMGQPGPDNTYGWGRVNASVAAASVTAPEIDIAVRIAAPREVLAGRETMLTVEVRNSGVADVAEVPVVLTIEGANITLTAGPIHSGGRVLLRHAWMTPREDGAHTLNVTVNTLDGEVDTEDNADNVTVLVTRLGTYTTHPWIRLTRGFDPARVVVAAGAEMKWKGNPDFNTDKFDVTVGFAMFDGFSGRGDSIEIAGVVVTQAQDHDNKDPLSGDMVALMAATNFILGVSGGGSAGSIATQNGDHIRPSEPGVCWAFPLAVKTHVHSTCWEGAMIAGAAGGVTQVQMNCGAAIRGLASAITTYGIDSALSISGTGFTMMDSVLWPLYTQNPDALLSGGPLSALPPIPAAFIPGVPLCIGGAAGASGLVLPAVGFERAALATQCATGGCAPLIATDILGTLPIQPVVSDLGLDLPIPLGPPRQVNASPGPTLGKINVTWVPPAGRVDHYNIYRGLDVNSQVLVATTDGKAWGYVDSDPTLEARTTYSYTVAAVKDGNEGPRSNEARSVRASLPDPIPGGTGTSRTTQVDTSLTWLASPYAGGGTVVYKIQSQCWGDWPVATTTATSWQGGYRCNNGSGKWYVVASNEFGDAARVQLVVTAIP